MKTTHCLTVHGCLLLALFITTGCGGAKKKQITDLQRKEAAHHASEAKFALTMRDYARAEESLAKAVALDPSAGPLWINLGAARVKQGKREAARTAYKEALDAFAALAKEKPAEVEPWLRQAYVLALLGREKDGRALLDKASRQFPADRTLRAFLEGKDFDRMISEPAFKEMAL